MTAIPNSRPQITSLEWRQFERIGAWIVLLGVFTTLFGLSWDVDWHSKVGPDTFWTLPHIFVYSGAALTGFAALTVVLLCTFSPRQAGWISILGKRIQKLHIKEYSRKKRDDLGLWKGFDVAFLEGDNNWPAIMKALDEIGYHGWGIAEQGGGDSPEGLLSLSTKMDKIFAS